MPFKVWGKTGKVQDIQGKLVKIPKGEKKENKIVEDIQQKLIKIP